MPPVAPVIKIVLGDWNVFTTLGALWNRYKSIVDVV